MTHDPAELRSADELIALAERVEKASGPDLQLDSAVRDELSDWVNLGGWWRRHKVTGVEERYTYQSAPAYTASLDAAMKLVPEGRTFSVARRVPGEGSRADIDFEWYGEAATPALALTAAALRARALAKDKHDG